MISKLPSGSYKLAHTGEHTVELASIPLQLVEYNVESVSAGREQVSPWHCPRNGLVDP